jgi:hypothetical protein
MCIPRTMLDYMNDLNVRQGEPLPTSYRTASRVGRGGRIVMDRIPVNICIKID